MLTPYEASLLFAALSPFACIWGIGVVALVIDWLIVESA